MPDIKFSQLPSATLPLAGSETIPLLQGGTNVRVPIKTRSAFVIFAGAAAAAGDRPNNRLKIVIEMSSRAQGSTLLSTAGGG